MRINRKLNLVIPVDTEKGTVWVHSTPISRETFEKHFLLLSKAFSAIYASGLSVLAGPRVSMLMIKRVAETDGAAKEAEELINEMHRLTNVAVQTPQKGWSTMPLDDAVSHGFIDQDDATEVDNAVAFFTVNSHIMDERNLGQIFDGMKSLWGAETSPLNCTAFASSLPTSTEIASSGATVPM